MVTADKVHTSNACVLIRTYLSDKHIRVSSEWLESLVQHLERTGQSGESSVEVCEVAILHFLNSDIQQSLDRAQSLLLPQASYDEKLTIDGSIILQIVSCEDIGSSLSSQLDGLDAYEEKLKPYDRRLVLPTGDEEEADLYSTNRTNDQCPVENMNSLIPKKTCKLLLEDAIGNRCYALEQKPIPEIRLGMSLGGKLLVQDALFVLGVMMLRPHKCIYLGGSIPEWHKEASLTGIRAQLSTKLARKCSNLRHVT